MLNLKFQTLKYDMNVKTCVQCYWELSNSISIIVIIINNIIMYINIMSSVALYVSYMRASPCHQPSIQRFIHSFAIYILFNIFLLEFPHFPLQHLSLAFPYHSFRLVLRIRCTKPILTTWY